MKQGVFDDVPIWGIFVLSCAVSWLALEGGFRIGVWRRARAPDEKEGLAGPMVASVLGLLGFMLAITFSIAASQFNARREVVLNEANAIGTTYLRARLLPEPQKSEVAKLLREYVDVRLPDRHGGFGVEAVNRAIRRSEELHQELWSRAVSAAEEEPTVMTGLFIQSLNEMIDLHAVRMLYGIRSRIPISVWLALYIIAALGMASTGYHAGLAGARRSLVTAGLVLAFASLLFLVADLDRPGEGLLRTSQDAMLDLQKAMKDLQ